MSDSRIYVFDNNIVKKICPWCNGNILLTKFERDARFSIYRCNNCKRNFATPKMKDEIIKTQKDIQYVNLSYITIRNVNAPVYTRIKHQNQCSRCGIPIPEGREYCIECAKEEREKLYES